MSRKLRREQLQQVQFVPLTAFDAHGALNLAPMRILTRRLYEAGARVFIPCAGSSEFHTLEADEIVAAIAMTRAETREDAVIIAPVGFQPAYAIRIGHTALDAGASAVLIMPLAFPYLSDTGAKDYYLTLLDQLKCPTLIYKKDDVPSNDLLLELAEHPHLIGVKYAVNDVSAFRAVVERDGGRIDWFCGSAERYAPFFALAGAPGYTSGAGNLCPRLTLAMQAALARADWPEAMRLQKIILPIEDYRARAASSYNVSFLKYAVTHTGLDFGAPRPPYRQLTPDERHEIDQLLPPILAAEAQLSEVASTAAL